MPKFPHLFSATIALISAVATVAPVQANDGERRARASVRLDGFQEVPQSIFTEGEGRVRLRLRGDEIHYTLRYSELTGDVTAAAGVHIHFGRPAVTGGITAFLCEGAGLAAPIGTPLCADDGTGSGVVRGVIRADDVLAIPGQGFPAGSISALWTIISEGAAYVNLHTDEFPAGEIRGDFQRRRDNDDD